MTKGGANLLGTGAILLWGTTIAFSRSLTERLGVFTAASAVFLLGGALACALFAASPRARRAARGLPPAYWAVCGSLFVAYMLCLYLAVGIARGRTQVVEAGMINYLWPSLVLAFSVPILEKSGRWTLLPGLLLAGGGVALALGAQGGVSLDTISRNLRANTPCYLLALGAAVTWGLYSNLCRRLAGPGGGTGVPVFLLATGVVLLGLRAFRPEESEWSGRALLELGWTAVFPTFLAYRFWEIAMRAGDHTLVASMSYAIPVLSTLVTCLYLGVPMGLALWIAAALVAVGATVCRLSVRDAVRNAARNAARDTD